MALQETMCELQAAMTKLATKEDMMGLATKDDIRQLRNEMEKLTATLTGRIEKLENSLFDIENRKDEMTSEISKLREENAELKTELARSTKETSILRQDMNEHEQHGRLWNVRVYGIQEGRGEETVEDCVKKCVDVFSRKLDVPVTIDDVEIAHRTGRPVVGSARPRPVILRFFSRRKRGQILTARRKLKQTGISVGEDLTKINYQLLKKVSVHSATMAAWTSNGKVLVKLKNGKTIKVDHHNNVDALFKKEMS